MKNRKEYIKEVHRIMEKVIKDYREKKKKEKKNGIRIYNEQ